MTNMKPLKIAYVIDSITTPSAGSERQLLLLLNGLDRSRVDPQMICLHNSEWLSVQKFDFPLTIYDVRTMLSPRSVSQMRQFAQLCREQAFDVVQSFFVDANMFGTLGAHMGDVPVILSSRRNIGGWLNRKHISMLRFLRKYTTRYIANSQAAADVATRVEYVHPEKIKIIHNGLNLDEFKTIDAVMRQQQRKKWGLADDNIVIGITANLRDVKNIDMLIRVAARLMADYPQLRFISVGEGPDRNALQRLIDTLGLTEIFQLVGRHANIVPCLSAFDIATLCSSHESLSNSLIEYMAARLPVVASDVGGNGEAVTHEKTGLLFPSGDEQMLEKHFRTLLENQELREKYGNAACESAFDRFDKGVCLESHMSFYEQLVEEARTLGKYPIRTDTTT